MLQQVGRGLRREANKSSCTVLDFVGHHHKEFRMQRRFGALLGGSRRQLERHIEQGFPFLPSGCHMQLDAVASQLVLENIRQNIPSTWRSEEHTSELQSLMRISYAVFCLKKKNKTINTHTT